MDLTELHELAETERAAQPLMRIRCCTAAGCMSANAQAVLDRLQSSVRAAGLEETVRVCGVGCLRLCCDGPLVQLDPDQTLYQKVTAEQAPSIVASLQGGEALAERADPNQPFFALQASVVLENSGRVEPERVESYIAAHGYQALGEVLRDMRPEQVVEICRRLCCVCCSRTPQGRFWHI